MKRNQLISLILLLQLSGSIYFFAGRRQKEIPKENIEKQGVVLVPVRAVKYTPRVVEVVTRGQIRLASEQIVSFEVQGKLKQGNNHLKPGDKFLKREILYQVDNEEAYYTMNSRKTRLSGLILNALPDLEREFPAEKKKWEDFMNRLRPNKMLPQLPNISTQEERSFLTKRTIIAEYNDVKSLEVRMEKYFYLAPFDGLVVAVFKEPGASIDPGAPIAKISKPGDYQVKVPMSDADLELYRSMGVAEFYTADGEKIGTGKIKRVSGEQDKAIALMDVYFSFNPQKGKKYAPGTAVDVIVNKKPIEESVVLPIVAVEDGNVQLLENGKLIKKEIQIVGTKSDSVFVTGIKDGSMVLLEYVENERHGIIYKGQRR